MFLYAQSAILYSLNPRGVEFLVPFHTKIPVDEMVVIGYFDRDRPFDRTGGHDAFVANGGRPPA